MRQRWSIRRLCRKLRDLELRAKDAYASRGFLPDTQLAATQRRNIKRMLRHRILKGGF